jgi:uncharacterized protein (TIGR02118 family)
MMKLIAFYRQPADRDAFERAYFETHVPLVRKIPGLQRLEINRITGAPRGEPDFILTSELYFQDRPAMDPALASQENLEAGKNLMSFAKGLASFVFVEELVS